MTIKLNNYEPAIKAGAEWENPKMKVSRYADDAAAGAAGLTAGDVYADNTGVLRVKS